MLRGADAMNASAGSVLGGCGVVWDTCVGEARLVGLGLYFAAMYDDAYEDHDDGV